MAKALILIAIIGLAISVSRVTAPAPSRGSNPGRPSSSTPSWVVAMCANLTWAQTYINSVRQLITNLTNNGSFTTVLQRHANAIAYWKSDAWTVSLTNNCTGVFASLKAAKDKDTMAMVAQQFLESYASSLYAGIMRTIFGRERGVPDNF